MQTYIITNGILRILIVKLKVNTCNKETVIAKMRTVSINNRTDIPMSNLLACMLDRGSPGVNEAREALSSPGMELLLRGELVLQESASIIAGVFSAEV